MRRFIKNTKGAVTVFVTLLLIPAVLVSGTAVDLARIHTARSILQDANQLAANSVLTQYDAMLQDIYGLYGIMEDDPILGDLLNEYIQVAVFGEDWQDKQLGTFQLFYGSGLQPTTVTPAEGKNLRNPDVLRRQIEEYVKFRAPAIIIDEIWERIDKFKKLKADSEAIEKKMAIDEKIDEIDKLYKEIYEKINEINKYPLHEQSAFESINQFLTDINAEMRELKRTRDDWTEAFDKENSELMSDLDRKYDGIKQNIRSLVTGGTVSSNWIPGNYNDEGNWEDGRWNKSIRSNGLNQAIGERKSVLNSYIVKMNELVGLCQKADKQKADLARMVDELEQKLNSGEVSDDLVRGMREPLSDTKSSVIQEYRGLLKYSLEPMAEAMRSKNESYIYRVIGTLNDVGFGEVDDQNSLDPTRSISRENLLVLSHPSFVIDYLVTQEKLSPTEDKLKQLAALRNYKYTEPNKFVRFQDFKSTHNEDFYKILHEKYNSETSDKKKEQEEIARGILKDAQEDYKDLLDIMTLTPEGAEYYKAENKDAAGNTNGFGNKGNWGNSNEASNQTKEALNENIISKIGTFSDEVGNKILLVTYVTEMFSNFTTESDTKTMSGIPMSTDVNYFYQSELEYLFNGNEKSARSNIATVSGLVLLARFVSNYISTFIIPVVNSDLLAISAPAGPFAPIVRELARLGYALAESVIDMKALLEGQGVPLVKLNNDQWKFSITGLLKDVIEDVAESGDEKKGDGGIFYIDYLRIFLLFQDDTIIANRTADLISWNITNKRNGIKAKENSMASATLYDMSKVFTDFTITSKVDLRMLFLSMPFAQKGINGVIPPKTMPVTVTDYRGY